MRNMPHRIMSLNLCSIIDGTILGTFEPLLQMVHFWGLGLHIYCLDPVTVLSS